MIARVEGDSVVIEADGEILPADAQATYQDYGEPDADSWIREWFGDNVPNGNAQGSRPDRQPAPKLGEADRPGEANSGR